MGINIVFILLFINRITLNNINIFIISTYVIYCIYPCYIKFISAIEINEIIKKFKTLIKLT